MTKLALGLPGCDGIPWDGNESAVYTSIANFAIVWASIDRLCPGLPGRSATASCTGSRRRRMPDLDCQRLDRHQAQVRAERRLGARSP